jgi:hypothetical protein
MYCVLKLKLNKRNLMKYFNEGHWKNEEMDGEGELNYLNKDKF